MITKGITEIKVSKATEQAIRNYICGNMLSLSEMARIMTKYEGKLYTRQSAVNLVATILPYWYKIGKIDLGDHIANEVGEL